MSCTLPHHQPSHLARRPPRSIASRAAVRPSTRSHAHPRAAQASACVGQCTPCHDPAPPSGATPSESGLLLPWWSLLLTAAAITSAISFASFFAIVFRVWWLRNKRESRDGAGGDARSMALLSRISKGLSPLETSLLSRPAHEALVAACVDADMNSVTCPPAVLHQRRIVQMELKFKRASYDTSSMVRIGALVSAHSSAGLGGSAGQRKATVFFDQRQVGLLGRGRFGTVCLGAVRWQPISGESAPMHQLVAVKTTMLTQESVGRVMRRDLSKRSHAAKISSIASAGAPAGATSEVKLLWAAHGHPNIVGLVGVVGGGVVVEHLVLELCAISLSERSLARQTPELRRLISIDTQLQYHLSTGLLHGLAHLHSLRICHRDVKPSNMMIFVRRARVSLSFFFSSLYISLALAVQHVPRLRVLSPPTRPAALAALRILSLDVVVAPSPTPACTPLTPSLCCPRLLRRPARPRCVPVRPPAPPSPPRSGPRPRRTA